MTASVNSFLPEQTFPNNVIDNSRASFKTEQGKLNSNHSASFFNVRIHKGSRLVDSSIGLIENEHGRLTLKHSSSFFHIIHKQQQNGGKPVRINSSEFQEIMCCK